MKFKNIQPRCQALDGTFHLLEEYSVGTNAPPMHPRCRSTICAVLGENIGKRIAKNSKGANIQIPASMTYAEWRKMLQSNKMSPRENIISNIPRTIEDVQKTAENLNKIIDKYFVRKSKWTGKMVESNLGYSAKDWNCDILAYLKNFPDIAILHELIHARSVSYYTAEIWFPNKAIEEASVQLLTYEIAKRENISIIKSAYDDWVNILRNFNLSIGAYENDLKFAQRLLRVPLSDRVEWMIAKAQKFINDKNGNIDELMQIIEPLYKIDWEVLMNERARINSKNP